MPRAYQPAAAALSVPMVAPAIAVSAPAIAVSAPAIAVSDAPLLSSEQLNLGGYATVRGYETNEISGDDGILLRNELHSSAFSPLTDLWKNYQDRLVFLFFWDYALATNRKLSIFEDRTKILSSIGPGLRYSVGSAISLRVDWGFQLKDSTVSPTGRNSRFETGLTISY